MTPGFLVWAIEYLDSDMLINIRISGGEIDFGRGSQKEVYFWTL